MPEVNPPIPYPVFYLQGQIARLINKVNHTRSYKKRDRLNRRIKRLNARLVAKTLEES